MTKRTRFEESHATPKPGMTPEERKRGLRAAVDAKVRDWMRNRDPQFTLLHATEIERAAFAMRAGVDTMWQIIDSLVEECAEYTAVLNEFVADVEAADPLHVHETWPDLHTTYEKAQTLIVKQRVRPADTKGNA